MHKSREPVMLEWQISLPCNSFIDKEFHLSFKNEEQYELLLDIPSKYTQDLCVIVSVAVGIFSERLTDLSCEDFPFGLWHFPN